VEGALLHADSRTKLNFPWLSRRAAQDVLAALGILAPRVTALT